MGGLNDDAIISAEEKGLVISTGVLEKGLPSTPMRAPFPGFCWQLALRMVMTGARC